MSFDEDLLRANRSALTHAGVLYAFSYEEVIRTRRVPEMEDEGGSVAVWVVLTGKVVVSANASKHFKGAEESLERALLPFGDVLPLKKTSKFLKVDFVFCFELVESEAIR